MRPDSRVLIELIRLLNVENISPLRLRQMVPLLDGIRSHNAGHHLELMSLLLDSCGCYSASTEGDALGSTFVGLYKSSS